MVWSLGGAGAVARVPPRRRGGGSAGGEDEAREARSVGAGICRGIAG